MKIALNAGSFSKNNFDLFLILSKAHPEEKFYFIFHKEPLLTVWPSNVHVIIIPSKNEFELNRNSWYTIKMRRALKKIEADIFISERSILIKSKITQVLISPELSFLFSSSILDKKDEIFYKKNNPDFFNIANQILVNSIFLKKEIIDRYHIPEEKLKVIFPEIISGFTPPSFEEREKLKERYANGNEYFIYKGPIGNNENLLNLLKAFSFFKKRQRSKMQLILTGEQSPDFDVFLESIRLFRFKEEVKILIDILPGEIQNILSCSYAMVYVPLFKSDPVEVVEAMNCGVPLVVSSNDILKEYCGEAALYADPSDFKNIAELMMVLFKDEQKRKDLIAKEKPSLNKFTTDKPEHILWEIIKR